MVVVGPWGPGRARRRRRLHRDGSGDAGRVDAGRARRRLEIAAHAEPEDSGHSRRAKSLRRVRLDPRAPTKSWFIRRLVRRMGLARRPLPSPEPGRPGRSQPRLRPVERPVCPTARVAARAASPRPRLSSSRFARWPVRRMGLARRPPRRPRPFVPSGSMRGKAPPPHQQRLETGAALLTTRSRSAGGAIRSEGR